jgi:[ribosomal protein S5]-alanine N-acetyltransferase
MNTTPTFTTNRLILKLPSLEHAADLQNYINDWEVARNFSKGFPWPYPADGAVVFLRDVALPNQGKTRWTWGIFLKEQPEHLIGIVEIFRDPKIKWNRGFWLARKFWNKGYVSEAVVPVLDFAFNQLGFERMLFANAKANIGSSKIKSKTAGTFLHIEKLEHVDPTHDQTEVWELTKEQWLKS